MKRTLARLARLLPADELHFDEATRAAHAGDKWFASHPPDAVALPRSTGSVAAIMRFAHAHRIPVTARGAGHGYVGGCVPLQGGIALSLARMNRIREIHAGDFVAVVQPGVLTQRLQDAVEARGLFYPPDPASRADCTLGGNIVTNAGGPRCLKYGVTRDYVLGLEVVLADGTVVRLGSRTHKNKTGFDLARFFVGSEGLLGIVTEATLKLLPRPPYRAAIAAGFGSTRDATRAIQSIFRAGFLPCALEVADAFTLAAARRQARPSHPGSLGNSRGDLPVSALQSASACPHGQGGPPCKPTPKRAPRKPRSSSTPSSPVNGTAGSSGSASGPPSATATAA